MNANSVMRVPLQNIAVKGDQYTPTSAKLRLPTYLCRRDLDTVALLDRDSGHDRTHPRMRLVMAAIALEHQPARQALAVTQKDAEGRPSLRPDLLPP
jgi:hypothetical protein